MEPLDRELVEATKPRTPSRGAARILLVGLGQELVEQLRVAVQGRRHVCQVAERLVDAQTLVTRQRFDVILLDPRLDEGRGFTLLPVLQKTAPPTKTIVLTSSPSASLIVEAMRGGAVDVLDSCVDELPQMLARLDAAIIRARIDQQREDRLARLKRICRELNVARREVTAQVDGLCNDLAAAYQDIGTQMTDLSMATEFRTLIKQELDVEDLLRTSLEYLLTKTGATNAAVFLSDHDRNFGLGAYVNYDCPRESIAVLLDHLCQAICPQMSEESQIVAFEDAAEFAQWIGLDEAGFLGDSQVLAYACRHGGECLAVVVLFRSKTEPFDEQLAGTIDVLRPIFAEQLANVIAIHHRASNAPWPEEAYDGDDDPDLNTDDFGFGIAA